LIRLLQNLLKSIQTDCRIGRKGRRNESADGFSLVVLYEIASKPLILFILFQFENPFVKNSLTKGYTVFVLSATHLRRIKSHGRGPNARTSSTCGEFVPFVRA